MEKHNERVELIGKQVRKFHDEKKSFRIFHGSTLSTRDTVRTREGVIDTSLLDSVLKVDTGTKTALVEPNVPMDALVKATLQHGLVPPVIMELPNITVGGGFAGTSGESSSFKYGLFDCNINWIEIVLGDGEIINASAADPNTSDIFYGAAGSCGSLGVITLLELQLIDEKPFVELTYHPTGGIEDALEKLKESVDDFSLEYLDGILFTKDQGVVMKGRLADLPNGDAKVQKFTRAWDPWFYLHAQEQIKTTAEVPKVEYIPIEDYLFRYDRGQFWGGACAFEYFYMPFNWVTRTLLNPLMNTRTVNHAFHESGLADRTIVQDTALPYSTIVEYVGYLDETLKIYPLWLCPVRPSQEMLKDPHKHFAMGKDLLPDPMLYNVGVWGMGPSDHDAFVRLNRDIEDKVRELHGLKCLYAHAYYTEEEFWAIYDKEWYEGLRKKYRAENIPSMYEKVRVKPRGQLPQNWKPWLKEMIRRTWLLNGIYGVYKALLGRDYLLSR